MFPPFDHILLYKMLLLLFFFYNIEFLKYGSQILYTVQQRMGKKIAFYITESIIVAE